MAAQSAQESPTPAVISSRSELDELVAALRDADIVGVDTEFERERTYYPKLCLIQLAFRDRIALVDPLAGLDPGPLLDALGHRDLTLVFHAARQDLEIFQMLTGTIPGPVFDTQVAAAILGLGEQLSYGNLVEQVLGVQVGKSHARTNWSKRPLAGAQLRYALEDVRHLLPLHAHLGRELHSRDREQWAIEAMAALEDPALYQVLPADAWQRVRGATRLSPVALARLKALAAWRENLAIAADRPRKWIVDDRALVALTTLEGGPGCDYGKVPGLPAKLVKREHATLNKLLADARPEESKPASAAAAMGRQANGLLRKLSTAVKQEAEVLRTCPSVLATRSQIAELLSDEPDESPLLRGWRREVIGAKLLAIIEAERSAGLSPPKSPP